MNKTSHAKKSLLLSALALLTVTSTAPATVTYKCVDGAGITDSARPSNDPDNILLPSQFQDTCSFPSNIRFGCWTNTVGSNDFYNANSISWAAGKAVRCSDIRFMDVYAFQSLQTRVPAGTTFVRATAQIRALSSTGTILDYQNDNSPGTGWTSKPIPANTAELELIAFHEYN